MIKSIKDSQLVYLIESFISKLNNKVSKVDGKDLSTNDFTNADKTKLNSISEGAEANQNAFAAIKFNEIGIVADNTTDILHISSGSNITFTIDEENDSIAINSNYSIASTNSDGLMSKEDKLVIEAMKEHLKQFGIRIYSQNDEPSDAPEGSIWIDLDEEA